MDKLFFKPDYAWVGDLIPYYENGTYYAYYLHDPRITPGEFAEQTTWHLATTEDCRKFRYQGEAIARGGDDRPNKNIYTGSVIKKGENEYYAFYTAYNADIRIHGKSVQSVMRASSQDLIHWETDEDFLFVADDCMYEAFDWRDPFVFKNEEEGNYWMLLAARKKGGGAHRGGCTALCKSRDLVNWTCEEPFYAPEMYVTMECPEVFRMGSWWYLVFSTFSDRFTTHYRMAKTLDGPWEIPKDDVFDTRADYAIKTASDGQRRFAFGWIASKAGNSDYGPWEWGGTMVAHEIVQEEDGTLRVKPTEAMKNFYDQVWPVKDLCYYHCTAKEEAGETTIQSETLGAVLFPVPEQGFELELTMIPGKSAEAGVALHTDTGMENGYFLRMDLSGHTAAWDMWPRSVQGAYQWQIKGDVPCQVETSRKLPASDTYHIRIFREDDLCVLYINDCMAMSTRMYDHKGGYGGIYTVGGTASVSGYQIKVKSI